MSTTKTSTWNDQEFPHNKPTAAPLPKTAPPKTAPPSQQSCISFASIKPSQLAEILKVNKENTVILDTRGYCDFEHAHVTGAIVVRGSRLQMRRLNQHRIGIRDVIVDSSNRWAEVTHKKKLVVCYDAKAVQENVVINTDNPLHIVMKYLLSNEIDAVFLSGGFDKFSAEYPEWVTKTTPKNDISALHSFSRTAMPPRGFGRSALSDSLLSSSFTECHREAPHRRPIVARAHFALSSPVMTPLPVDLTAPASCVRDFLFIGSRTDSQCYKFLMSKNITHILNVTKDSENFFEADPSLTYLRIPISDTWNQALQSHFPAAFRFIDDARSVGGRVLVHCQAGISRSAAFVIGYLMYKEHLSLDEAYRQVRFKREIISPNLDFMGELTEYESLLKRYYS
eukprot:gene1779-4890_t